MQLYSIIIYTNKFFESKVLEAMNLSQIETQITFQSVYSNMHSIIIIIYIYIYYIMPLLIKLPISQQDTDNYLHAMRMCRGGSYHKITLYMFVNSKIV